MMGQSIQQGAGQPLRPQHLGPLGKGQVAGYQCGSPFVTLTEDFEQHFGSGLGQGHEPEFVHDQQFLACQVPLIAQQALLIPRFDQLVHQRRRGGEAYANSLLTGRQSQCKADVGLPRSAVAKSQHVLPPADPLTPRQLHHQLLVQ